MPPPIIFSHLTMNLLPPLNEAVTTGPLIYNCVQKGFLSCLSNGPPGEKKGEGGEQNKTALIAWTKGSLSLFEMLMDSS